MKNDFDLVIIGGGIVGCNLFSFASLQGVKVCLLEKGMDVAEGASKANSGIVHSGYDPMPKTLMAKFNVLGAKMYPALAKRLGVTYLKTGTLTVSDLDGREKLEMLKARGEKNGVKGLEILEEEALKKLEPNLAEDVKLGLYAKEAGVISPYEFCIALMEEAVINGGTLKTNFNVDKIEKEDGRYKIFSGDDFVRAKYLVNCAGANASDINKLLNDKVYEESFVKGEYILLDKNQVGFVSRPIFPLPSEKGKGILANITTHGNILFGPTATPCEKDDTSCTSEGIDQIKKSIGRTVKMPNFKKTIKLFAGVRVKCGEDFIIKKSKRNQNYFYTMGICSPGLTSAPAIAKYLLKALVRCGLETKKITAKKRIPYICMNDLPLQKQNKKIKENSLYGKLVCRCEGISEGEIVDALKAPNCPPSVDAVKRRVRATMGRCQGSFCTPKLIKIIAQEKGISPEEVLLSDEGSNLVFGDVKGGANDEN